MVNVVVANRIVGATDTCMPSMIARRARFEFALTTLHCCTHPRVMLAGIPSLLKGLAVAACIFAMAVSFQVTLAACVGAASGCFSARGCGNVTVLLRPEEIGVVALNTSGFCRRPSVGFERDNYFARCASWCPPAAAYVSTSNPSVPAVIQMLLCIVAVLAGFGEGICVVWKMSRCKIDIKKT